MFRSIKHSQGELITIYFEGRALSVSKDHNVATALLEADINGFRKTTLNNENRGPYCMMGVCFDCLININDVDNQQSCTTQISDGMKIKRQIMNTPGKDE